MARELYLTVMRRLWEESAAIGGTTTVLDFSQANKNEDTVAAAASKIRRFSDSSPLDFTIKPMMVTDDFSSPERLETIFSELSKLSSSMRYCGHVSPYMSTPCFLALSIISGEFLVEGKISWQGGDMNGKRR